MVHLNCCLGREAATPEVSKWARLVSNQRPLACEAMAPQARMGVARRDGCAWMYVDVRGCTSYWAPERPGCPIRAMPLCMERAMNREMLRRLTLATMPPAPETATIGRVMQILRLSRRHIRLVIPLAGLVVLVAGGAAAAVESDTIDGFWAGVWWALSLMTTVGFVGSEPLTTAGRVLSAVLMVTGFLLLATITATIASVFVREEEQPEQRALQELENRVLSEVGEVKEQLRRIENRLDRDG